MGHKSRFVRLDFLYDNIGQLGDPCVYCGQESSEWDHVPSMSYVDSLSTEDRNHAHLRKLPACHECNPWLNSLKLHTLRERRSYVKRKLRSKYRTWIEMPEWSETELLELSTDDARRYIGAHSRFAQAVRARLAYYGLTSAAILTPQVTLKFAPRYRQQICPQCRRLFSCRGNGPQIYCSPGCRPNYHHTMGKKEREPTEQGRRPPLATRPSALTGTPSAGHGTPTERQTRVAL